MQLPAFSSIGLTFAASPINARRAFASLARLTGRTPKELKRLIEREAPRHVPEAGGWGLPGGHGRRQRVLPPGRRGRRLRRAGPGPSRRLVHRPLRLLRRLPQLLRDVVVPVHHVRAGGGDRRPGVDVVRDERRAVRAGDAAHGLPLRLLLLLPRQDARPVRPAGAPLRRLLRPLLLRALRPLPGVPRAQEARLRHEPRMAREHGEAGAHAGDHAAAHAPGDDALMHAASGCCSSLLAR